MIDPISIGLAFAAAQKTVSTIKQAVAMGKDVNSLFNQFAHFFENSDKIHAEHNKIKAGITELTDGQIRAMSLQIAMQSKQLRDAEVELKNLLVWSGNKDVWDEMQRERVRMFKERKEREEFAKRAKAEGHMAVIDKILLWICFAVIVFPIYGFILYGMTSK